MLKFTHNFCKYTNFACINAYRLNLKEHYHLTLSTRCKIFNCTFLRNPFVAGCPWGRFLSNETKDRREVCKMEELNEEVPRSPSSSQLSMEPSEPIIISSDSESAPSDDEDEDDFHFNYFIQEPCTRLQSQNSFRVLSFNVLSQYLLETHPHLYQGCAPQNLKWDNRFLKIVNIIVKTDADIICLQEVEDEHLTYFSLKLEGMGFKGFYKKKITKKDGCAIFYKVSKFKVQDMFTVEFFQPGIPVLDRDNVACLVKLLLRGNPKALPFVVATTHLLYNPRRVDVRLAQCRLLLAELDRFAYYDTGKRCGHYPIILTGDFNSRPNSKVVDLIRKGYLRDPIVNDKTCDWSAIAVTNNCQHFSVFTKRLPGYTARSFAATMINNTDYRPALSYDEIDYDTYIYPQLFSGITLTHPFKFLSAYDHVKPNGKAECTTCQNGWATVDYIFYSDSNHLKFESRLPLPSASQAARLNMMPNEQCPSDHFPLMATFSLSM